MHVPAIVTIHPCLRRRSSIELLSFLSLLVYQESKKQIQREIRLLFRLWRRAAVAENRWELAALIQCPTLQHEREGNTGCDNLRRIELQLLCIFGLSQDSSSYLSLANRVTSQALLKSWIISFQGLFVLNYSGPLKIQDSNGQSEKNYQRTIKNWSIGLPEEATASSFYCKDHTLCSTLV